MYPGLLDTCEEKSTDFIGRTGNKAWLTGFNRKINGKKEVTALFLRSYVPVFKKPEPFPVVCLIHVEMYLLLGFSTKVV